MTYSTAMPFCALIIPFFSRWSHCVSELSIWATSSLLSLPWIKNAKLDEWIHFRMLRVSHASPGDMAEALGAYLLLPNHVLPVHVSSLLLRWCLWLQLHIYSVSATPAYVHQDYLLLMTAAAGCVELLLPSNHMATFTFGSGWRHHSQHRCCKCQKTYKVYMQSGHPSHFSGLCYFQKGPRWSPGCACFCRGPLQVILIHCSVFLEGQRGNLAA